MIRRNEYDATKETYGDCQTDVSMFIIIISIQPFGLVCTGTRAQSGDRYGSGTLHPG